MGSFDGVNVQVISGGKTLQLYDDPDSEPSPRLRQRYVEAITGATFKVRIVLSNQFDLCNLRPDDAVEVAIYYDGQEECYCDYEAQSLRRVWRRGMVQEHIFTTMKSFCNETQEWKEGDTSFGALDTSDTAGAGMSIDDVKNLGTIRLLVRRIRRTKKAVPIQCERHAHETVTKVSEKILKGKAIENSIRTSNSTLSTAPPPQEYDAEALKGVDGEPLIYNIFYRSRNTLQMLGCIPRTPSPEPETSAEANKREARVRALRAELAALEGNSNVKREGSGVRTKMKRELEDKENEHPRKRSRGLGVVETVDLTGD